MDATTLLVAIALIGLIGALASIIGADTRDGFDGEQLPTAGSGPRFAL